MKVGSYEIQVPFVTTSTDNLKIIMQLVSPLPGKRVIDLGSGDGRVVLEFAKEGAIVHGCEIKEELVIRSRERIAKAGLDEFAKIYHKSFWEVDLALYDIVYIYGMRSILGKVEKKLEKELKPGALFISNIFRLPNWKPKKTMQNIHLYKK